MSECVNVSTVGIDPDFQSEINFYPNPTGGLLNIELGKYYSAVETEIVNLLGQGFFIQQHTNTDKISIKLPDQQGFYFVKIKAEGKVAVVKVLKNN